MQHVPGCFPPRPLIYFREELRGHFDQSTLPNNNISIERKHADIVMLAVHLLRLLVVLVLPEARAGPPTEGSTTLILLPARLPGPITVK
jgi:hypothetical protein